ncbi:AbrB/MazE/SpoVT family DNA-binding domain-containing protein [candidate division CSSED10-310 bacterium]|uniref:AbrB/MazE/SpoVT family DNA-binding domain-containing protein n=1 Tax=candidate division CSSED10-310 bacterium TaxID=2855610 RepID=A0ABV6Z2L3_UNCC1
MAITTLTKKGQVTIPKKIREVLGLQTGDKIEFIVSKDGEARIKPVTKKIDDVYGLLFKPSRKPVSTDEMDRSVRERLKTRFT